MAGTELGKAWVQIVPSAKGISGSISDALNGEADSAGKKAGLGIAGGVKKIIAAAGIGVALKKSLDLGGELQQNLGGTEAVFGKHAESLQAKAKEAYKNMGLSASDYMATANKMGSLFQGSGVSQVKSLDMTEKAMQRAADVASVMGIDTSMAMESIAGAAKGNFTMMDNLGVAMNATTLKAYALEKGINFDWNTADNAQKAELAMQMFMDRTSQYAGNFARESQETLSGSIGAMKAAGQDLLANLALGTDVSTSMQNLVTSAIGAVSNILPAIGNIFKSLPTAIGAAIQTGLPLIGQSAESLIQTLISGINTYAPQIAAALPGAVSSAIQRITTVLPQVIAKAGELIKSLGSAIAANAPQLASAAATTIKTLVTFISSHMPEIAAKGGELLGKLIEGLIKNLPKIAATAVKIVAFLAANMAKMIGTLIRSGLALIGGVASGITSGIRSKVSSAMEQLKSALTRPIEAAKETVRGILNKIKGFFPLSVGKIFSNLKVPHINVSGGSAPFGIGGLGTKPSISVSWYKKAEDNPYMFHGAHLFGAGESNDEILYGRSALMRDIAEASGKGRTVQINNYITVDGADDPEDWANRFVRELQLEMRTA